MGQVRDAKRIGPEELVEIEGPPEIHRRQAFAKPGDLRCSVPITRSII